MDDNQKLLDALYLGATDAQSFELAIAMLAARFGCGSSALALVDQQMPYANMFLTTGVLDPESSRRYSEYYGALDPAPAAVLKLDAGGVSPTRRLLGDQHHRGEFFNDYYKSYGFEEALCANLFSESGRIAVLALHRGKERDEFSKDDIAELQRWIPHVTRALQLRRTFAQRQYHADGLASALDRIEAGVVVLNGDDKAVFVNATMRAIAERRDGLSLDRNGRPRAIKSDVQIRLSALINDAATGGPGGMLAVSRDHQARAYPVLVSQLATSLQLPLLGEGRGAVIVLVHDPDSRPRRAEEILQVGFGLTPGAARLVAALAADDDLKAFAQREGVTIHTARFHLRTALTRTGTKTQSDLVRSAVRLLRDMALRG
jgi:DNA-binding CsgD family transcriptional regulator